MDIGEAPMGFSETPMEFAGPPMCFGEARNASHEVVPPGVSQSNHHSKRLPGSATKSSQARRKMSQSIRRVVRFLVGS